MIIRELTKGELKQAAELKCQCEYEDYKDIIPQDSINVEEEFKFTDEWLNDKECNDIRRIYGVFDDKTFLGYVGGSLAEKEDAENGVEINLLFVEKEHRGAALGLKLFKSILDEFRHYGVEKVIVYNWHECESNKFYRALGGQVIKQMIQKPGGKEALVDVFSWDLKTLRETLISKLYSRPIEKGGFRVENTLKEGIVLTNDANDEDCDTVCRGLLKHNVTRTNGLLSKPGVAINLYLKDKGETIGAILCDTYNFCLYVDVLWIDDRYRGKGLGKDLIFQAEEIARDNGCTFSHTCTLSYQAPEFYKACGYKVFGELDDFQEGIVQYFLKKKL